MARRSFLSTELEQNWEAVDGSQRGAEKKHFFINICRRVLQEGQARGCPEDAAACAVGEWGWVGDSFPERPQGPGPSRFGVNHSIWSSCCGSAG